MTHGDDSGLVLPPRDGAVSGRDRADWTRELARNRSAAGQGDPAGTVAAGIRVTLDERDERPGWKFAEWELRGVPLRLEIGPKDIEKSQVLIARRDTREKQSIPMEGLADRVRELLDDDAADAARTRACISASEHTQRVTDYDAFKETMEGRPGFVIAPGAAPPTAKRTSRPTRRRRSATCRSMGQRRPDHASAATPRRSRKRGSRRATEVVSR